MKKWFLHILLLAGLFGVLTTSCSQEEGLELSDEKVQISFTLAMDGAPLSRATWDSYSPSEIGAGIDNIINNLQVLLFKNDDAGTFIGEVENAIYIQQSDAVFEFIGDISISSSAISNEKLNCKVMVLANCNVDKDKVENLGSSDEYGALFSKTFQFNANPDAIPMWGIQKVTDVNVVPGKRSELSPIYLLRAMAKIEVIMEAKNSNNEFYTFSSVQLNNYNSTGYTLPNGWNTAVATESMDIDGNDRTFRPLSSKQELTSFTRVTDQKYVIYVPEYDNLGGNATPSTITVNIDGKEYPIYFKDYSSTDGGNNPDYDIERNHIYRYTITAVNTSKPIGGFTITYMVTDWNEVTDLDLDFGYDSGDAFDEGLPTPYDPEQSDEENGETGNEGDETPEQ